MNPQFEESTIWEAYCAWIETAVSRTLTIMGSHPKKGHPLCFDLSTEALPSHMLGEIPDH